VAGIKAVNREKQQEDSSCKWNLHQMSLWSGWK